MKNKNTYHFLILLVVFLLTSCTKSKSIKQINLIDKNITNIQQEVKEVKKNIVKTKQAIVKVKQEQPLCNIETIESQIVFLEYHTNTIDDNLSFLKSDLGKTKFMIEMEVKEYKSKYLKYKISTYLLILLLLLILINYIKGNFTANLKKIFKYVVDFKNKI